MNNWIPIQPVLTQNNESQTANLATPSTQTFNTFTIQILGGPNPYKDNRPHVHTNLLPSNQHMEMKIMSQN